MMTPDVLLQSNNQTSFRFPILHSFLSISSSEGSSISFSNALKVDPRVQLPEDILPTSFDEPLQVSCHFPFSRYNISELCIEPDQVIDQLTCFFRERDIGCEMASKYCMKVQYKTDVTHISFFTKSKSPNIYLIEITRYDDIGVQKVFRMVKEFLVAKKMIDVEKEYQHIEEFCSQLKKSRELTHIPLQIENGKQFVRDLQAYQLLMQNNSLCFQEGGLAYFAAQESVDFLINRIEDVFPRLIQGISCEYPDALVILGRLVCHKGAYATKFVQYKNPGCMDTAIGMFCEKVLNGRITERYLRESANLYKIIIAAEIPQETFGEHVVRRLTPYL
jgi:hypothetical protein